MKKDKLFYWQRGYNAFESGKWIVAFGQCNSWQRKAYKAGYETARLYSYATHDNPTDYQLDKLKSIIKGQNMKTNRLFWWQHRIIMECFVSSGMSAHEAFHEAYKEMKKA